MPLSAPMLVATAQSGARIIAFLLLGALGACAREEASWTPAEAPQRVRADWRSESHLVAFPAGAVAPSSEETGKLAYFLTAALRSGEERLALGIPTSGDTQLAERRAQALRRVVASLAPDQPVTVAPVADPRLRDGAVLVTVGRYVVTTPSCPDWRKPSGIDAGNSRMSNIGCANETNLGLMIADPADLVVGQTLAPADGEATARGVRRYREGKVKPLPKDADTLSTAK